MAYTLNCLISSTDVEEVEPRVRQALSAYGFGVLTEIDVKATLKQKIGEDIAPYKILGACNPTMAHQAIGMEPRVGAMLPCNVILRQVGADVEVSAIDPVSSMQAIDNVELKAVAGQVRDLLQQVVDAL